MRRVLERIDQIADTGANVLIRGETGTGKEVVARLVHASSQRRSGPFVAMNMAAIPEALAESELFGYEKGAFTGADRGRRGKFRAAEGGTLFLDEIGDMPKGLQGKLLRTLEERAARRGGGTRTISFDVRVIAATHVDLAAAVRRGEFREDLYFRLNVVPLELPPLRARREDILPLARHFVTRFAREYGLPEPTLTAGAERELLMRRWPGNVRELRNAVERAILLGGREQLDASDFAPESVAATDSDGGLPFPATLGTIARAAATEMLARCEGNKSEAARRLGISRPRLQRLLDAANAPDLDDEESDAR
jgi:DNA-binding NtrC family response regulator